jgi:hypothetical protein
MTTSRCNPKAMHPRLLPAPAQRPRAQALRLMGLLVYWDAVQSDAARLAWTS